MSEKIKTILAILIILLILPYIITYALQGNMLFELGNKFAQGNEAENAQPDSSVEEPTEILIGILAGQISMDEPTEAIRAQAVLVRTEYAYRQASGETQEKSLSVEEFAALWGSQRLQENYETAHAAIVDTAGEILTYEGKPIRIAYHKVSAGSTRAVDEINGISTPYLVSVICGADITSPDYLTVRFFSKDELFRVLNLAETDEWSQPVIQADEAGYVKTIQIGDITWSGDQFREALELPSPCFYLKEVEGKLRVVVKGKGHGIGMSQYGAAQLAQKGASYQEILNYFFPDTRLEKI